MVSPMSCPIKKRRKKSSADFLFGLANDNGTSLAFKGVNSLVEVYNTVNLLCECGILRKLQFGDQQAQYEKLLSKANHHHLICTECGKIKDVKDPEFVLYMNSKKYNAFTISYFSFYVYGICNNCLRRLKQSKKQ